MIFYDPKTGELFELVYYRRKTGRFGKKPVVRRSGFVWQWVRRSTLERCEFIGWI